MGFFLLLQGKPPQALKTSTKDRNVQDFWEVHAIASTFKNELGISQEVNEEDLGVCVRNNIWHTSYHKDLTWRAVIAAPECVFPVQRSPASMNETANTWSQKPTASSSVCGDTFTTPVSRLCGPGQAWGRRKGFFYVHHHGIPEMGEPLRVHMLSPPAREYQEWLWASVGHPEIKSFNTYSNSRLLIFDTLFRSAVRSAIGLQMLQTALFQCLLSSSFVCLSVCLFLWPVTCGIAVGVHLLFSLSFFTTEKADRSDDAGGKMRGQPF